MLGLTTGSTKDLIRLIMRAFLGDADGEWGSLGRRRNTVRGNNLNDAGLQGEYTNGYK